MKLYKIDSVNNVGIFLVILVTEITANLSGSQEKLYNLTSEDVTSSSRCSRKMYGNVTDFHKTLDLKDHSRADMLG